MLHPLRVCKMCNLVVFEKEDLYLFKKSKLSKYGRSMVCKSCHNKVQREYKKDNRELYNAYEAKRRAIKRDTELIEDEKDAIDLVYTLCREISRLTGTEHHVDHIIPLAKGGTHTLDNLQIITALENLRKNAKVDYYD